MTRIRSDRRSLICLAGGALLTLGPGVPVSAAGGDDHFLAQELPVGDLDGTFEAVGGGLVVEWDTDLYQVNTNLTSDISIYLNDGRSKGYEFNSGYANHDWTNEPGTVDLAIEQWFSLGISGVEIVQTWTDNDGFAFFFTSDYGDYRGLRYFEYLYVPEEDYPWIVSTFSCDVGPDGNDVSRAGEFIDAITLNGQSIPNFLSVEDLVELIEQNNL